MEFLIGIGTSIIGKVAEYTVEPVAHQIGYFFCYKRNVDNLKTQIQDLKFAKERTEHSVSAARNNGEEIEGDVCNWLRKAETIFDEAGKLLPTDDGQANTRCSSRSFSKLIKRYKLSKEAKKMAQVITQVQEAGKFSKVSYRPAPNSSFKIKGYEAFDSRASIVEEIKEALKDDGVRMIGVWGMAGVGKTMLVKEVARQAKSENLFTQVVLTTISQTQDHIQVQEEVAENLGLKLEENTMSVRANRLKDCLRNEKKILIILDDLWSKLDLEDVGISFADDQKECKILLTSRSGDVLRNEMGADRCFKLEILYYVEATDLFNQLVGDLENENEFQAVKKQIVEECAGLPLAVSTIANALKNKSISIWKNALLELRTSSPVNIKGADEKVYSSIKLSYNFLESEEAKSLLLLCSLHKEDADVAIDDLLKYGMGLSLFDGIRKLDDARNRVFHLVENLKTSSLLFDGRNGNYVRMHDVIRDVVLSIASKDRQMYFISSLKELNERLNNEELENSTTISCLDWGTKDPLRGRLSCPKLQLFSLQYFWSYTYRIPNQFFEGENKLQVLRLHYVDWNLSSSLSSFQFLKNLKTLILTESKLGDVTMVGELKSLEILNFSGSDLMVVPKQIGKLTRLRSLELNHCMFLEVIEPGAISSLELLEELSMIGSGILFFTGWAACLTEVKQLRHLTTLLLDIKNAPNVLPSDFFTDKLERFNIHVASSSSWTFPIHNERAADSRSLFLDRLSNNLLEQSGLKILIKKAENLHISIESVNDFFYELGEGIFSQLKILTFCNDATVRYIINRHSCSNTTAFQSLEELHLDNLKNLETICSARDLSEDSFSKLRLIVVRNCHSLKNLFPLSVACRQLEKIEVSNCSAIEEIFTNVESRCDFKEMIEFPQLQSVELERLPKLMQFCGVLPAARRRDEEQLNADAVSACLQPLFHHKVAFPNLQMMKLVQLYRLEMIWQGDRQLITDSFCKLKEIRIRGCNTLTKAFPSNLLRNLQSLTKLKISHCAKLEEVFEIRRCTTVEENCERIIPQLTSLKLEFLPSLKHVWSFKDQCDHQLGTSRYTSHKLKKVRLSYCINIKSLFPASVAKGLLHLESLELQNCYGIRELVEKKEGAIETISKFVFPQLTTLSLCDLSKLECCYPGLHSSEWPSLRKLKLKSCLSIKILASQLLNFKENLSEEAHAKTTLFLMETVAFPNLQMMNLSELYRLEKIWQGDRELITGSFCKLKEIRINECKTLTNVFPSNFMRNLRSLTELKIRFCGKLEEVFEIRISTTVEESCERTIPQSTSLELDYLPNLKKVSVTFCDGLKSLFPVSVAKGLPQLESLELCYCNKIRELVAKKEGEAETIPKFVFPRLTDLSLSTLPQLECFYPGQHSLGCPSLRKLGLKNCIRLKNLSFTTTDLQGKHELHSKFLKDGRDTKDCSLYHDEGSKVSGAEGSEVSEEEDRNG